MIGREASVEKVLRPGRDAGRLKKGGFTSLETRLDACPSQYESVSVLLPLFTMDSSCCVV